MTLGKEDDQKKRIEDMVMQTMASLDHVPPPFPPPHFTDRVMTASVRIEEETWDGLFTMILSRRLASALLTVFLLANLATVWIAMRDVDHARARFGNSASLAGQYGLDVTNPFEPTVTR